MLKKRLIACLDVKDGKVVKGVKFRDHEVVGEILDLAKRYAATGCDELVFYDIAASPEGRGVGKDWVLKVAREIDIPFCVAGGLRSLDDAKRVLNAGADKISINSPALERPEMITELAKAFGVQCVVVGVDSYEEDGVYHVHQYTGDPEKSKRAHRETLSWLREAESRGAGEIVLNCMNRDGVREGYDCDQMALARDILSIPLIASGGAGKKEHFLEVLAHSDGALAAGVFHRGELSFPDLKGYLEGEGVAVRGVDS